jgi:hypothetical protein
MKENLRSCDSSRYAPEAQLYGELSSGSLVHSRNTTLMVQ